MMLLSRISRRRSLLALVSCSAALVLGFDVHSQSISQRRKGSKTNSKWLDLPETPKLPAALREGWLPINGTRIFFAQFGNGPSVLLLHGGLANWNYWGAQVEELSKAFCVTVMDTRGHGRSPLVLDA